MSQHTSLSTNQPMVMNIRLDITLTETEQWYLISQAAMLGFMRSEPRKAWTNSERREAIRWVMEKYLREVLAERTPRNG